MIIKSVFDKSFKRYGQVIEGYDFSELLEKLVEVSEKPLDKVIYEPSCTALEELPIYKLLRDNVYGGMPIEIGYCNGNTVSLNCLEYHRDSELQLSTEDTLLMIGLREDIDSDWTYDTSKVETFFCPKGTMVELSATTLHFSPLSTDANEGFRMIIVLPRGTNTEKPDIEPHCYEDRLITLRNKWLLPHPDSNEAKAGAVVGLKGENPNIAHMLPYHG